MKFFRQVFAFALKNIPIPTNDAFMKSLIYRTEDLLIRIRWVAFFFLKHEEEKKERLRKKCNREGTLKLL